MFCQGSVLHDNIDSQLKCQELCLHDGFTGCFGVAYFEMAMNCYVCNDYNIVPSNPVVDGGHDMDSDGFYRHPSNKELICFTTIFKDILIVYEIIIGLFILSRKHLAPFCHH